MHKLDLQRRSILQGAIATGCALGMPVLFVGCSRNDNQDTRTADTEPTARQAPDTAEPEGNTTPRQGGKMSKQQARYQQQPEEDQQCSNCMHFIADNNTCKLVEGQVSPQGWCMLWARKA